MENLKLLPLTEEDAQEYIEIASEANKKNTPLRLYASGFKASNKKEFMELLDSNRQFGNTLLGIRNEKNQLVGVIALENVFISDTREVSFFIGSQFRNKGYATQALSLMVQKLRGSNIKKLAFTVSKDNKYSLNIVNLKLGAKYNHDYESNEEVHILDI